MKTELVNISSHFYKNIIFKTFVTFLLPIMANAQESIVHGKIVAFDSIPIERAEIKLKRTKTLVLSDSLGFFSIKCQINDKLSIKVAGFKTKKLKIENQLDSLHINLKFGGSTKDIEAASSNGHIAKYML